MKYLYLIALSLVIVGCGYEEGDNITNTTVEVAGNYIGDGAYYIEQNGDGTITSCTVTDSNRTCTEEEYSEVQELVDSGEGA